MDIIALICEMVFVLWLVSALRDWYRQARGLDHVRMREGDPRLDKSSEASDTDGVATAPATWKAVRPASSKPTSSPTIRTIPPA